MQLQNNVGYCMKENRIMWKMHNDNQYAKGTIAASSAVLQNSFNEVKAFW